jgi:hypothetical protein
MPAPMTPNPKKPFNWARFSKTLSFWILVILIPIAFLTWTGGRETQSPEIDYTAYREQLERGNIKAVTFQPDNVMLGQLNQSVKIGPREAKRFTVRLVPGSAAEEGKLLFSRGVRISSQEARPNFGSLLITILPYVLLIGFWIFLFRQMQAGGNKAFSFGKSKAKLLSGDTPKITFADVAGADEAKVELQEIIEFLKDPQKFTKLGGRLPKGALLVGPPGTGKTLLAKAVAGEAGVRSSRCRVQTSSRCSSASAPRACATCSNRARRNAPCIIFIDEIDAVGRHARRWSRRWARRARADAQSAARRDGRLRVQRRRDPHRRDQPSRRARSGAAAPGPLRPPDRRRCARPARSRGHSQGAPAQQAAGGRRERPPRWRAARRGWRVPTWPTSSTKAPCSRPERGTTRST